MKDKTIAYIALGVGAFILLDKLSNNKLSSAIPQYITESAGESMGNTIIYTPVGLFQGLWNAGYKFGYNLKIPIIDDIYKALFTFMRG